jgi:hypothetical protein
VKSHSRLRVAGIFTLSPQESAIILHLYFAKTRWEKRSAS